MENLVDVESKTNPRQKNLVVVETKTNQEWKKAVKTETLTRLSLYSEVTQPHFLHLGIEFDYLITKAWLICNG